MSLFCLSFRQPLGSFNDVSTMFYLFHSMAKAKRGPTDLGGVRFATTRWTSEFVWRGFTLRKSLPIGDPAGKETGPITVCDPCKQLR